MFISRKITPINLGQSAIKMQIVVAEKPCLLNRSPLGSPLPLNTFERYEKPKQI